MYFPFSVLEPIYKCDLCDRLFRRKASLEKHKKTFRHQRRQGVTSFPQNHLCPRCGKSYHRWVWLCICKPQSTLEPFTGFPQVLESLKSPGIWKKILGPGKVLKFDKKYPRSLKSPWIFILMYAQLIISSWVEATFSEDVWTCDFYTAAISLKLFQIITMFWIQNYTSFQK